MNSTYDHIVDIKNEIKNNLDKKICLLLMSGGIDSSTSLILLQKDGYHVIGIHYDFGDTYKTKLPNKCCTIEDLSDAKIIAKKAGIKLFTLDYKEKFEKEIINTFIEKKERGLHFNPCTLCHEKVKYGPEIMDLVRKYNIKIASGYYVKIKDNKLLKPKDSKKNQTQSIIMKLKDQDIPYLLFPLGNYSKKQVREIAKMHGMHIHSKKESMGLCFVGERNIKDFISSYCRMNSGDVFYKNIETGNLEKLAKNHKGLGLYQIGENSGFNKTINGKPTPLYVFNKDIYKNCLIVSTKKSTLFDSFYSTDFNLIGYEVNDISSTELEVKFNSNLPSLPCKVLTSNSELRIILDKKLEGIVEGEIFLLYDGDNIVGGGIIEIRNE